MKLKIAKFISVAGHPMLTIPLFVAIVMLASEDFKNGSFVLFLIIGCVFVPAALVMYFKSRNGSYTNFDVSDRRQRKTLYVYILPLLIAVTVILFLTGQSVNLCLSVLFATMLIFISQLVNLFVKSSLHVSLNFYLAFLVFTLNIRAGIVLILFTGLIGWSRIVLGRHTIKEVLLGGCIGIIVGLIMLYAEGYL